MHVLREDFCKYFLVLLLILKQMNDIFQFYTSAGNFIYEEVEVTFLKNIYYTIDNITKRWLRRIACDSKVVPNPETFHELWK